MPRAHASSRPISSYDSDKEALLSALNAHGQSFLQSFGSLPSATGGKRKRAPSPAPHEEGEDEEWQGIAQFSASSSGVDNSADESESSKHKSASLPHTGPRVVVFSQTNGGDRAPSSHANRKAFMSSKVSRMRADAVQAHSAEDAEDEEEEKFNTRNDILLHELVQNSLMSGALDAGDEKTPSKKRKAIEGRAMELAGAVRRGRGQRVLQTTERGHAPKHIREGMQLKEAELKARRLEEAKNVGNYHPTIKKLFCADERAPQRKRERGLSLGVGKFVRGTGTLKLTPRDLARVRGSSTGGDNSGGRGGRGGSRGKGKSRR